MNVFSGDTHYILDHPALYQVGQCFVSPRRCLVTNSGRRGLVEPIGGQPVVTHQPAGFGAGQSGTPCYRDHAATVIVPFPDAHCLAERAAWVTPSDSNGLLPLLTVIAH